MPKTLYFYEKIGKISKHSHLPLRSSLRTIRTLPNGPSRFSCGRPC